MFYYQERQPVTLPGLWLSTKLLCRPSLSSPGFPVMSLKVFPPSDLPLRVIQQLRGPNFTQFWPPTRPECPIVDILHTTFPLFTRPSVNFLLTTYLPLFVNVVIKWPLSVFIRVFSRLGTIFFVVIHRSGWKLIGFGDYINDFWFSKVVFLSFFWPFSFIVWSVPKIWRLTIDIGRQFSVVHIIFMYILNMFDCILIIIVIIFFLIISCVAIISVLVTIIINIVVIIIWN